jgi:hypothetical protein
MPFRNFLAVLDVLEQETSVTLLDLSAHAVKHASHESLEKKRTRPGRMNSPAWNRRPGSGRDSYPSQRTRRMGADTAGRTDVFTRGGRMGHPSIAPISCTRLWTGPRVRVSFKERRMKCREPTNLHRKSGLVAGIDRKSAFIPPPLLSGRSSEAHRRYLPSCLIGQHLANGVRTVRSV